MKPMKKQIQDGLRKQPKTTKDRSRVARNVSKPAAKNTGQKVSKPAASKGEKE